MKHCLIRHGLGKHDRVRVHRCHSPSNGGGVGTPATSRDRIGIAVVGLGWIGRRHASLAQAHHRSRLVLAVDSNPDQLAQATSTWQPLKQSTEWSTALTDPDVDAVVIATPPFNRGELCAAAIAAEKPVLVEKPVCVNAASMRRLVEQCANARIQVAHHARYSWDLQQFRTLLEEGTVGRVLSVQVTGSLRRPVEPNSWYFDPERGGGVIRESLGHSIDLIRWLLSAEFESVGAEWCVAATTDVTFDHTVAVLGRLRSGVLVSVLCSLGGAPGVGLHQTVQVIGTDGVVDFDLNRRPTRFISTSTQGLPMMVHPDRSDPPVGALASQWEAFLNVAQGLAAPAPDLHDALATMEVVEAVEAAAREGQRLLLVD